MKAPLVDRVAIITGASRGLGLEIARRYVKAGAHVAVCARDDKRLRAACEVLQALDGGSRVIMVPADVSRSEDVRMLVDKVVETFGRIDILVNNAGVYGPKGAIGEVPWGEWVRTFEINVFGAVLMARAVVPHLRRATRGKIVQLSGGGATNPLPFMSAYAASKAAVIRFVETLAEELRRDGIDVNAIAPGALNTRMLDEVLEAGPEKVGAEFYAKALEQKQSGGSPLRAGAELAVFLASAASDGITGKLISAIWDPWPELSAHVDELASSDVYTLRRIVPKDRGMTWGER